MIFEIKVTNESKGNRLDVFLSSEIEKFTRSKVQKLIKQKKISIKEVESSPDSDYKIKGGETFIIHDTTIDRYPGVKPQNIPINVVYEDEHLLVVNKDPGIVVHPGSGTFDGTLVNALMYYCSNTLSQIGGEDRPGIVHRLDKDTSGLMVIAKNDYIHSELSKQFSDRTLSREYVTFVWGKPKVKNGTIDKPIRRHTINRKKMCVTEKGRVAITNYCLSETYTIDRNCVVSKLLLKLGTGRTHQIRVHCQSEGFPVIGDPVYGKSKLSKDCPEFLSSFNRQALHAITLSFYHPVLKEIIKVESNLPKDMEELNVNLLNLSEL